MFSVQEGSSFFRERKLHMLNERYTRVGRKQKKLKRLATWYERELLFLPFLPVKAKIEIGCCSKRPMTIRPGIKRATFCYVYFSRCLKKLSMLGGLHEYAVHVRGVFIGVWSMLSGLFGCCD
jgi:hypothetical protein